MSAGTKVPACFYIGDWLEVSRLKNPALPGFFVGHRLWIPNPACPSSTA